MTKTPQKADKEIAVCTAVSKNYLAYARVLSKSLREQHPSVRIFVLLVDRLEGAFDPKKEPFELIEIEELDNIPDPENFFFKYKPIELNTAAKPYLFEYLFRNYGLRKLIFLDPDILVLDPLTTIWNLLDSNNIVLTPHITEPYRDDRHPDEKHILQSGIFNLGFIAMANTPVTAEFLTWWQERLYEFCFMNIAQGMHVDQNWVNFAPVMFDGIHILKDPAYNIAYWNLHYRGRALSLDQGKWTIQGTPVVFFHFSGFETDDIEKISKHQDRFRLRDLPRLRPLFEHYRDLLLENEHQTIMKWKYAYDYFDNGVRITEFIRSVYNHLTKAGYSFENPFATKQAETFFRWLNKGIDAEQSSADLLITNLMAFIYSNRIDIRFVYQKPLDRDRRAFIQWFRTFGKRECQLDDALIPGSERFAVVSSPPLTGVGARRVVSASEGRSEERPLPSGINVAGYFNGEFGVAEAARDSVRALQTTQIPFVLNNIMAPGHRHHDLSFKEFSPDNPYFINLIHVNADQAKVFRDLKGEPYFKGRYNIGVWFWELEDFPKKWLSSFQYYDEIWAKSEFCRQAFARVSPVPVVRIKNPIILDEKTIKPDRSKFSLSQKEFVFLFLFDYASVFERKNPLGTISAFQKAFSKNDNVRLLIKSINSQQAPDKVALLQAAAGDHKISFIDRHLDPGDMLSLLASVDCFVSLHRSEGFGLGMAQSMYLGRPVIATWYSGNMDFMNAQNSFLVDYKLVELKQDYGPYEKGNVWAEPDIGHATELMRLVYNDRVLSEKKAQQAAWDIRMEFSPQVVGAEMQARVHQIYQGQTPSFQKTTEVSIVIPAFNRIDLTRQCLNAIPQTAGDIPYEIIVVDNGSTDGTSDYLRQEQAAGRLQAVLNSGNLGFAKACNQGAKTAKGSYLLFLNNDTLPHPGWLEEMVNLAESDKDIGIVGSKLLFPDGTIQHAGVVVSSNKLPYHIYRGLPGAIPCANKQRDYQIVTAACMLIKKDLFLKVGAFDERFVNGCEDLDLCLKVRQEHKRVVYNPKSVLTHFEAQTAGRQDKMDFNRRLFLSIWQDKIQQDDRHFLEQDGMALQIGPDGSFRFIPSDKPGTLITEPPSLKPSIIIVTFNSAKTIRACIDSVLKYTPGAEVIVVDNASADVTQSVLAEYKGRITTILNNENKGFSFACNQGIRASKGEYVILLNPDTVVTPMWKERLLAHFSPGVGAVGPLTNYTTSTQLSSVYAKDLRNWETLKTNERAEKLYEWNSGQARETKLLVGFCLAIPRRVLDEVGLLDEDLFLGSEDLEISWRLRQRGYKLIIAVDTFVYHEGQVSFKSVEKRPSTKESDQKLYEKLVAHYGKDNVPHPMELWGVDYFKPEGARFKPLRPTFAAVYCVYDDTTWLRESIESVYNAVDALYFLISDKPWFGQATDNKTTLEYIRTFPDPLHKIKVTEGTWTNETDQRNKGLDILKEAGIAYCLVIDADEIYDPMELKHMMEFAGSHPEIDCWHITLDTYWKSYRYRIEPREPLTPPVFIKIKDARFVQNRLAKCNNPGMIPPETGICHHLSYARSDAEVLKKITTFSHAHEVNPGWFEKVWKRWDADHLLTDLHPTHPHNYQRAVEQPFSGLPPVLKKRYLSDEIETTGGAVIAGLTSIIILAHNQWSQTERCLESIGRHTLEPHEIIVVDNNSTDETRERLREMVRRQGIITPPHLPLDKGRSKEGLKVISNNTNRGYAAGNNQGLSIARGEYLLLLNNDTVVTPGWLGRMTGIFKRYPKTGVAGPISNNVTRPQLAENVDYDKVGGIDGFAEKWAKEHEGQSFTTTKASGFCLLTRREVIDTIGGLDEQFGSGNFEDDDFCSRAFLTGFEIRIVQDVFIHHEGSQTFKGAGIDYNAKMMRNWELYKAKWDIPKDTPLDRYWVPSRIPETVSHFFPLPDLSFDHNVDPENRWWEDFRKKEEQGEEKVMKKERSKGLTSLIVLLSGHSGYARTCVESIQRHTKEPHEILFVPMEASYTPLKWLRKMLKENKNYRLVPVNSPLEKGDKGGCLSESKEKSKAQPPAPPLLRGNNAVPPVSYASACNRGLAEAKGEYLAILRDTLVVTEGWLSGMREHLNSTSIIGPMTVNVEGRQGVILQGVKIPTSGEPPPPEEINEYARSFRERNRYRRVPVKTLDSFCLLFTHTLTDKVGLFDERFETDEYAGDDYCIRAAVEGCQNLIAGDVFIHYYGLQPLPTLKDRIAFGKKWGDAGEAKPESKGVYCANALLLSDELSQKGQKEQAVVTLVEAIKLYPDERRLRYALAETLIEGMKYNEALDLLEALPGEFKGDEKRLELMGSCKIYLGQGEDADRYADELLLLNNASPKAWNLKGTVAFQKKSYADAERFFQKAIESDRGFGEAYANIGALRWADSKKEEALQLFEKAFILSPTAEDIVTNYYTAVVALSQLPAAEKTFREAIALYPFNRRLEFVLIDNLLQQGKYPEAMEEMEKALAIFGVDDDTLAVALKLREQVGPKKAETRGDSPASLSLCMIVKNEEKNIIRALQRVKPLVDEMIVVDTGSTDRTKKIATAFGAKVYDFQWTDSFSDARNFSLSKATGDWILVLDADEVISERDYGKLRELVTTENSPLEKGDQGGCLSESKEKGKTQPPTPPLLRGNSSEHGVATAFSFVTRNYVGPMSANWNPNDGEYKEEAGSGWFPSAKVRLFPNDSRVRFEKPVHETVEDSLLRSGYEISTSDIPVHHYGKLDEEVIRAKGEEYYQLGKKKLSEKGEYDLQSVYELAVQATELKKYDEALIFWEKTIAAKPDFAKAYFGMGTCFYNLTRFEEARSAFKKAMQLDPTYKEAAVMCATCELLMGNAGAAVSILQEVLTNEPRYPLALLAFTAACFCADRKAEGLTSAIKMKDTQFGLAPYLKDIAVILISVKQYKYAQLLLEAAIETDNATAETRQLLEECRDSQKGSRLQEAGESDEPLKKKS